MRFLAIDLGDQRTGLAAGDDATRLVSPLRVLEVPIAHDAGERLLAAIADAAIAQLGPPPAPGELVLGLPLNMDGSEGPAATKVRALAARLAKLTGRTTHLHDERLTSADADWTMARSGLTRGQKKSRRDALAAAAILRDFLDQRPPAPTT